MLSKAATLRSRHINFRALRRGLATVEKGTDSPIAEDGRHEIWREGIYDHDNEPKVSQYILET
jgi:hypothetical protein